MNANHTESSHRVVGFDLDGTLLSCQHRQVAVAEHLAASYKPKRFDPAAFWAAKRDGAPTSGALRRLGFAEAEASAIATDWERQIEDDRWLARDVELPGARRALARLRDERVGAVVITARRSESSLRRQLAALRLDAVLPHVIVVPPRDAAANKAAMLTMVAPIAFIGDTESDADAAERAGVPFLAVSSGQRSIGFWRARRDADVFDGVEDAVAHLLAQSPARA